MEKNITNIYLKLFENPYVVKPFKELAAYYASYGMEDESTAFNNLIKGLFLNDESISDTHSDS